MFDRIDTAFTYMAPGDRLFKVVNVPFTDDMAEYCRTALEAAQVQKEYFAGPLGNDVFQCSPMPWVTYTHISHTNSEKGITRRPFLTGGNITRKTGGR